MFYVAKVHILFDISAFEGQKMHEISFFKTK
jgi:hypothetical protein